MGSLAQHFTRGYSLRLRDCSKAGKLRLTEPRHTFSSITVGPFDLVDFLARSFHQIAEKSRFIVFDIHTQQSLTTAGSPVKAA